MIATRGGNPYIEITQFIDPDDNKCGLVRFDISEIPFDAVVVSATLELYLQGLRGGTDDKEVDIHRITEDWVEGTGVGDFDGDPLAAGVDWISKPSHDPTTIDSCIVRDDVGTWYSFDLTVAARAWLEDRVTNYGIYLLEDSPTGNGTKLFASSENPAPSLRPRPTIVILY